MQVNTKIQSKINFGPKEMALGKHYIKIENTFSITEVLIDVSGNIF